MKILNFIKELFKTIIIGGVALILILVIYQMATGDVHSYSVLDVFF